MKILALYTTRTLSLLRRVQSPFSVLAMRGHTFAFMQVSHFDASLAMGHDITLLQNWVLSDEENRELTEAVAQGSHFAYDLSEPDLLQVPQVRETMRQCRLISVPNAHLKKEVEIAIRSSRVVVLPSTIDKEYLLLANTYERPEQRVIACMGSYDWTMITEVLQDLHARDPDLLFLGDTHAQQILGELITPIALSVETYPMLLRQSLLALAPIEQFRGQDTIWEHEFGFLGKPVIRFNSIQAKDTTRSVQRIIQLLNGQDRQKVAQLVHEEAKGQSSFRLADQYLHAYRQLLPYLVRPY